MSYFSLMLSPNPTQPWLAVSTANMRQLQVYNYETHNLKYQLKFNAGMYHNTLCTCNAMHQSINCTDYEKAVVSFAPNGQ